MSEEIKGELNEEELSPAYYFDHVKSMKETLTGDDQQLVIDNILKMMEKSKITGQTLMAKKLAEECKLALRELDALNAGFDIFVSRRNVEKYIDLVEGKAVKIIELKDYTREIPDEYLDKIAKASEIFDKLYIVFTDYALKETKKVAKHRREKDPILFAAFCDDKDSTKPYVEDKLFFICDWVEENCDLTLKELVQLARDKDKIDITYKLTSPKSIEDVKKMLDSYNKPIEEIMEPVSIFEKVKNKIIGSNKKSTGKKEKYKYSCDCGELKLAKYSPRKCKECGSRVKKIED